MVGWVHTLTLFFSSSKDLLVLPICQVQPRAGCQGSGLMQSTQGSAGPEQSGEGQREWEGQTRSIRDLLSAPPWQCPTAYSTPPL